MPGKRFLRRRGRIRICLLASVLIVCISISRLCSSRDAAKACIKDRCFSLELAITSQEHSRGLMFRQALGQDQAMLFVYNDEQPRAFWMKNTYIPLDIIWIDSSRRVVGVAAQAQPCLKEACPLYRSQDPVQYVLEVNAGIAEEIGLEQGDQFCFDIK